MPSIPKPSYKRFKPSRKQRGYVTLQTYEKVAERDNYSCVRCVKHARHKDKHGFYIKTEIAHIINKSQGGTGQASNLAVLCGPKVNSGTCHNWVDETREGKAWFKEWAKANLNEKGNY